MTATIKTPFHYYYFDLSNPDQRDAYNRLAVARRPVTLWKISTYGDGHIDFQQQLRKIVGVATGFSGVASASVDIETAHLFSNQWNTAPIPGVSENGLRVFEWSEYVFQNRNIREGYYLDIPAALRSLMDNTHVCGYCGKQEPAAKGYVFCPHCLDSEFLKEKELYLTRMRAVSTPGRANRPPLSAVEQAVLLPAYRDAQLHGSTARGKQRIAVSLRAIETKYTQAIADATEERDAARWIMANVPGLIGNWIFYNHSARHCFGWRTPLDSTRLSELLNVVSEFPFAYDIKCDDGRKLSGD
jgi:hypothetical protein